MTTPPTILSEQVIRDAMPDVEQTCVGISPGFDTNVYSFRWPHIEKFARTIESAAIKAYAAKLAEGVELEAVARVFYEWPDTGPKLGWNSYAAMNAAILDESRQEVRLVPLSTAQAAVAAERVKAARTAIEMMARDGWKCVPRIMTGDMVSVWRIRSHNGGSIESCFAAAVDASTDWADWKEIRA